MAKSKKLTPMLRHFLEVKEAYPDALLFYRMGDFYELFFEDAVRAAEVLQVTLTARQKGTPNEVPMCGVPHHSLDSYLGRVVNAGLKAAICDQVEDPAEAKGLVKREVTRVVTPGTLSQPDLLEGKEDNLLASLLWDDEGCGAGAFLDVSTGNFFARRWDRPESALEDLGVLRPREVLREPGRTPDTVETWVQAEIACVTDLQGDILPDRRRAIELLTDQLGTSSLRGFGLDESELATRAAASALAYAQETQQNDLLHVRAFSVRDSGETVVLDATTLSNLEVFRSQREGTRKGSLLSVLDRTVTSAGGRLLKDWLRRPLKDADTIDARHDAVEEVAADGRLREQIRGALAEVGDAERLLSRAVLGSLSPREAATLRDSLHRTPEILAALAPFKAALLGEIAATDPLPDLAAELTRLLEDEPPATFKNGGVIAPGVDPELDHCRSLQRDSKAHILALEASEREKTGISSLKIRYNRVFGYYLEVTKANQHLVPEHYIRKQTLVNAERYITPEVKELEEKVLSAEERALELETYYYNAVLDRITEEGQGLRTLAASLAHLDVLVGFAEQAVRGRYCRPTIHPAGAPLVVREGRHPVVESMSTEPFVPNDVSLDAEAAQIVVLTGPNMGGKSTYLRQIALQVLMAQAGCFVPAQSAEIGLVDRIFTRVGASDDLARGESTFMVEMIETANILHHATEHSLVILDEVGRGTATFDGLSLAWAIVEYLHEHRRPKTLFATHYHELTELASLLPRVVNRTLAVKEWKDQIIFLRRVQEGTADKSYGLHVARLAGLPESVLERAAQVLSNLEEKELAPDGSSVSSLSQEEPAETKSREQLSLFKSAEDLVADVLRELDLDEMTPLAALNLLASLKGRL